ncbi:sensor histidine kinase [Echinimonas agarilytica]|uniref:Histidine kinase n=1 Tax=Echinimonas agarilytica TaxID=1215918 RepID=A0AA42B646_9GAMM|nr:histidine kinase [Echinimonas agarilytica]MCM2678367.1 histidine kinase [Echinimonas agarilytica]
MNTQSDHQPPRRMLTQATMVQRVKEACKNHPVFLFWSWQAGFWMFFSVENFITLTLWYSAPSWPYIVHTALQAVLGLLLSLCMYPVYLKLWYKSAVTRIFWILLMVSVVSLVWTLIRMQTFILMTGEQHIWPDFGGWLHASVFIILCWTCMFHGVRYYQLLESEHRDFLKAEAETREEQLKRMKAQTVARDAQIKMLRYQLNPHFLCNTLNAINSLVEAKMSETAQEMTVKLSRFLRYSLDNNPDTEVQLVKEIAALNLYLDIESTRFGERLNVDLNIEPNAEQALVPSLLLQPIIENSMKYAIAVNEDGGTIGIHASVNEHQLLIELWDTGSGCDIQVNHIKAGNGLGVGLRNTEERLNTLYPNTHQFELSITPNGGLKTTISIPYRCAN